jgi:hypothetical protein
MDRFFVIFLLTLISIKAFSQVNTISGTTSSSSSKEQSKFSGFLTATASSNFYDRTSTDSQASTSVEGILNYKVSNKDILRAYAGVEKDLSQSYENELVDSHIGYLRPVVKKFNKVVSNGLQARLAIPLSKNSRERDSKITGVTVIPFFVANLSPVGATGLTMTYLPMMTKNFHAYKQNRTGTNNTEYAINHVLSNMYNFHDRWSVIANFILAQGWTYNGTYKDPSFSADQSLSFGLTQSAWLSLGHSNGSTLSRFDGGRDSRPELFNKNTSTYFLSLTAIF